MSDEKTHERIDHILLRLGIVSDEQIAQALMRQKSHGGRIGTHLLYQKAVNEEQLVRALAAQKQTPGVVLGGRKVAGEVIQRLTLEVAEQNQALPFKFQVETRTLCVAMADPLEQSALKRIQRACRGIQIKPYVACEIVLINQIARHYRGREGRVLDQIIELPALFVDEPSENSMLGSDAKESPVPAVLMISRTAFHKNVLPSVFEREGMHLDVSSNVDEIDARMREHHFEQLLIAEDMEPTFVKWVREGRLPPLPSEIVVVGTVSGALLDNPVPYSTMFEALQHSLEQLAARRCRTSIWKPPYARICDEIERMSRPLGLRRLAVGGLQVAALLLVPSDLRVRPSGEYVPEALSFNDLDSSIEIARSLRFPWDVEACLRAFAEMISGLPNEGPARDNPKLALAAQLLALVWYRHSAFRSVEVPVRRLSEELMRQASHLASKSVIETYARLLATEARRRGRAPREQVLVVARHDERVQRFAAHLETVGYRTVRSVEVTEALRLYERSHPDAVLVASDEFAEEALVLCRTVRETSDALVYAVTERGGAELVRGLLDAGFNDVFVPPFDHAIMSSRLGRSLDVRRQEEPPTRNFGGTLAELPFVDLMQALGGSQKSVRIELRHPSGEEGTLYLNEGRMVHAVCGELSGAEAVYRFIAWGDHGTFSTESVVAFPESNIELPNHTLLLEGCRLLDEGAVETS
jgi:CheY-like chemotaxis protein